MTNIRVTVRDGKADAVLTGVLTTGMVGVPVEFSFGQEWQGLSITAVFKGSAASIDRVLIGTCQTTVPHEVLALEGSSLWIGAEGRNAVGDLVIPSTMVRVGQILPGADPSGDASLDPSQPVWAELMALVKTFAEESVKSVNGKMPDENGNVALEDLISPTVNVKDTLGGVVITITDKSGTTTAKVKDGENGMTPIKGVDYFTKADVVEIAEHAAGLVEVPSDDHINSLIDAKLGVIENGTY